MTWFDVAEQRDFENGTWHPVEVEDRSLLIFNLNNEFYAVENRCTHDGGTLSDGFVEKDEIVCPRHGAHFCIKTGQVTQPPAFEDIQTFPIRVRDGIVQVFLEE